MRYGSPEAISRLHQMGTEAMQAGDMQAATFFMNGLAQAAHANHGAAIVYQERVSLAETGSQRLYREVDKLRWLNGLYAEATEQSGIEIAQYRRQVDTLSEAANTDVRTGLPNARALEVALARAEADDDTSVVHFDINGFGVVNKLAGFGENEGDEQLQEVAACLVIAAEEFGLTERSVFRKGGDEMTALVPKAKSVNEDKKDEVDFYPADTGRELVVVDARQIGDDTIKRHYRLKPETPAERAERLARTTPERVTRAEAIRRRAEELYGYAVYVGHYGKKGLRSTIVSLSGSVGNTFAEADASLQDTKQQTKAKWSALHPELAAIAFNPDVDKA